MDNTVKEGVGEILGTMIITTDEYKELVKRSAILDIILSNEVDSKYPSILEREVLYYRHTFGLDMGGVPKAPKEQDDAE